MELLNFSDRGLAEDRAISREFLLPAISKLQLESDTYFSMIPENNYQNYQGTYASQYPQEVPVRPDNGYHFQGTQGNFSENVPAMTNMTVHRLSSQDKPPYLLPDNFVYEPNFKKPFSDPGYSSSTNFGQGAFQPIPQPELPHLQHSLLEASCVPSPHDLPHHHEVQASHQQSHYLPLYPDVTTLVNSNSISAPMVELKFVDHKVCSICSKRIARDMTRHMRIHQSEKRFNCLFPKEACRHKSGQFNRRYDFKKHLLNKHFVFDDPSIGRVHNLRDMLNDWGTCPCGRRFSSSDWLKNHILTEDRQERCPEVIE